MTTPQNPYKRLKNKPAESNRGSDVKPAASWGAIFGASKAAKPAGKPAQNGQPTPHLPISGDVLQSPEVRQPEAAGVNKRPRTETRSGAAPLAERVRPSSLEAYTGQSGVVGPGSVLRRALEGNRVPSMILWGPPGCGKTTLARIICRQAVANCISMSAVNCGVAAVRAAVEQAKNHQGLHPGRQTILFLDEIHRFNKAQQDQLLPAVEAGHITLIGATTENPSFSLNSALISRCRVFVLEKLSVEALSQILDRAVREVYGEGKVEVPEEALRFLATMADGDARAALNALELAVESASVPVDTDPASPAPAVGDRPSGSSEAQPTNSASAAPAVRRVTLDSIKEALQKTHLHYDRDGEEHYNIMSALHKSIRGSDDNAALYWLARMLEAGEDPKYVSRRLMRMASEDIGLADPMALTQAVAAAQACQLVGMPECDVFLAQCAVSLARAPKSVEVYKAYGKAKHLVREQPAHPVPLHIRNAPTGLMKQLGYGKGYLYNPDFEGTEVDQTYLPEPLLGTDFFKSA